MLFNQIVKSQTDNCTPAISNITTTKSIYTDGNVDIHGKAKAIQLNVEVKWWSDFVFAPQYKPMNLSELEVFIQTNKHLPNIPTEKEVLDSGINVADMQALQLQKIEELTLYIIEQQKQIKEQKLQLDIQQKLLEDLMKKTEILLTPDK